MFLHNVIWQVLTMLQLRFLRARKFNVELSKKM
jgi:hypothetical protein